MVSSDVPGMDGEKLSVIVAVYNIENYLEKCVRSILAQTYYHLEIILVDDGATDGSGVLCDQLAQEDARIVVIHKENGGLSDARNVGIERATGEFLAFVDGDDWIDPDMYECMLRELNQYQADVAICRYKRIYQDRVEDESTGKVYFYEGNQALRMLLVEEDAIQIQNAAWNKLYRKNFLGGQRFPKGKWYEDVVYTTKLLAKASRCVYLDSAKYNYVIDREGSIMNAGFNKRILTDLIPAYLEKAAVLQELEDENLLRIHHYFYYKRLLLWYTQLFRSKDKTRQQFMKEIRTRILNEEPIDWGTYQWSGANQNEKKKLILFLKSPGIYHASMWLYDKILIPAKQLVRSRRN